MSLLLLYNIEPTSPYYVETYVIDYSNDHNYVDGIETISLTLNNPTTTPIAGVKAVRSTVSLKEIQKFASIGTNTPDVLFVIYMATTSFIPIEGDIITDVDDIKYTVTATRLLADLGQCRTFCTQIQS